MIWTLSNILSLSRAFLAVPLCIAIWHGNIFWTITVTLVGMFTDFLDGYFARRFNQITELGKILDPLGDKVIIGSAVVMMAIVGVLPLWFTIVVVARDVIIFTVGIYAKRRLGYVIASNALGKVTVNVISLVVVLMFVGVKEAETYGAVVATVFVVLSMLSYWLGMIKEFRSIGEDV